MNGCGGDSVESKLEKQGFEVGIETDAISITKKNDSVYAFDYSISEDEEEVFYFISVKDDYYVSYDLTSKFYLAFNDDRTCSIYKGKADDECTDADIKEFDEIKEEYSSILKDLDISEEELRAYMQKQYKDNFS